MDQYKQSGPPVAKVETAQSNNVPELRRQLEQQEAKIKQLESDLRKVRNDLRSLVNSLNSSRGKTNY